MLAVDAGVVQCLHRGLDERLNAILNSMTQNGPSEYETDIVRVFPDYAQSVIWFSDPMPYSETELSSELVDRLTSWEAQYYDALTDNFEWRSVNKLHAFNAQGLELAREVSNEIGPEFSVEYRSFENNAAIAQLHSDEPASNFSAGAAFRARAAHAREEWAATQARNAATPPTGTVGWYARSPSGTFFPLDGTK
ncbi:hypothetical protein [Cryobacterium sp. Y50]|uniref:hypothetical protein n=2 Tax=unclassified Cryobacterium TaxID=2649013 RepID=UPI001E5F6266|nr:hypothetical protein [Cryobacterium sp. Y50]